PSPARAQARAARALRKIQVEKTDAGWDLELFFEFPVRYLRHSPSKPSRMLQIQIDPIDLGPTERLEGPLRSNLPIPRDEPTPLLEVAYDASLPREPFVDLQFSQSLAFEVEQGTNIRSIRIRARIPQTKRESGEEATRGAVLLSRARDAIRDGNIDLAIALLSRVIELPEEEAAGTLKMDAQELIGLTHERRGQLAHAQAEYEAYLKAYPEGPAADRVRQRRDAIASAEDAPRAALRQAAQSGATDPETIQREIFGSLAARYFRSELMTSEAGDDFLASNVLADLDLAGRLESETWTLRGDLTGTYDFDVAGEGRSNDPRISRFSLQFEDRVHGWEVTLGRQRRNDSGVLGRFDGGRVAVELGTHVSLSALAGLPVERTSDNLPNTNAVFGAAAIDIKEIGLEALQSQLFVVGQERSGLKDRIAVGGEIRYAGERSYSFVYLDYDVLFNSLNTFLASASYQAADQTDLRLLFERRNAPVLTLESALQGQLARDLDALRRTFSESEIRDLALDRTAVAWSGSAGITHRLSPRYQLSADLTLSYLEGTETSAGVTGNDASGPDGSGTLQIVVNDWLIEGGVGSLSTRYFEGETFRSVSVNGYSSFRLPERVRLIPRLRWEWRDSEILGASSVLRPSIEIDWRFKSLLFNAEAGTQWQEPLSGGDEQAESNYFVEVGLRWEF
ncbi:MAG: hypothetical protein AB8G23_04110, partial [Myxococcota bacterium]